MIAVAKPSPRPYPPEQDAAEFETLLPRVERQARHAFRGLRRELREELVAEVIANAFLAYCRLIERDHADRVYPSALAKFAIRQVRQGRRVGNKMNVRDVSSYYCRRVQRIKRHPLAEDHECVRSQPWQEELLLEDRHASPAETAAIRIDFSAWLQTLDRRQRRIAKMLATHETTQRTARKFHLTPGRISQIRRELERAWQLFQGEAVAG